MKINSKNGSPRAGRGFVKIVGENVTITNAASPFAPPGTIADWIQYSIALREDAGWVVEPQGTDADFDTFYAALSTAQSVQIRGDHYKPSLTGIGMESVYLNWIRLYQ